MISHICRNFPEAFSRDEQQARTLGKKYFITRALGNGATGVVWLVRRTADNAPFALKIVNLEGMSGADKARASAEVHCLMSCNFFSILKCHDDFVKSDPSNAENPLLIALVLDYANAGDLRQEIKNRLQSQRPFKEHEAGLLFLQILMAIHHVHSNHMLHRDIKSANILLCANGLVKLGDFGFSKVYSGTVSDNVGKTFCGTPYYVAPEIWKRERYSKKADMFSLGVLLYEMLTLRRPFHADDMNAVRQQAIHGEYDPLPEEVSYEMAGIVRSFLDVDPIRRPSSGELLVHPIFKLFTAAFIEIVQPSSLTQGHTSPFEDAFRTKIEADVGAVRHSLVREARSQSQISTTFGNTCSTVQLDTSDCTGQVGSTVVFEGTVRRQSGDGSWKSRYLCIRRDQGNADLVVGIKKETLAQQSLVSPFKDLEDAFPLPSKYTGGNVPNAFSVAFITGKRLTFQATDAVQRDLWLSKIQETLGI